MNDDGHDQHQELASIYDESTDRYSRSCVTIRNIVSDQSEKPKGFTTRRDSPKLAPYSLSASSTQNMLSLKSNYESYATISAHMQSRALITSPNKNGHAPLDTISFYLCHRKPIRGPLKAMSQTQASSPPPASTQRPQSTRSLPMFRPSSSPSPCCKLHQDMQLISREPLLHYHHPRPE